MGMSNKINNTNTMQGFYIYIRDTPKGIKGEIKGVLYNARILYIYISGTHLREGL